MQVCSREFVPHETWFDRKFDKGRGEPCGCPPPKLAQNRRQMVDDARKFGSSREVVREYLEREVIFTFSLDRPFQSLPGATNGKTKETPNIHRGLDGLCL